MCNLLYTAVQRRIDRFHKRHAQKAPIVDTAFASAEDVNAYWQCFLSERPQQFKLL
jgi:hypothetical protein